MVTVMRRKQCVQLKLALTQVTSTLTKMEELFVGLEPYNLSGVTLTDKELGTGAYATVLQMDYLGLKCAGKRIHSALLGQCLGTSYTVQRFREECHILSCVRHPNIVQFLGVHFQKGVQVPILVMEYLPYTLTQCLSKYDPQKDTSYSILHDVALGLNYLHSQPSPIVHRDLSSNNVLLTFNMHAKISDLGVARILDLSPQFTPLTQTPGTPAFMPPEVMVAKPIYDTSVDVFSYGIMMMHVLSGKWPEPQVGPNRTEGGKLIPVSEAERREKYLLAIGNDNPLMDLILRCIENSPIMRCHVSKIVTRLKEMVEQFPRAFASQLHMADYIRKLETANKSLKEEILQFKGAHELLLLQRKQEYLLKVQRKQEEDRKEMNRLCSTMEEEVDKLKLKLMEVVKKATDRNVGADMYDFDEESNEQNVQDHHMPDRAVVYQGQRSKRDHNYVNTVPRPRRSSESDSPKRVKSPSDGIHPIVVHGLKSNRGGRQRSFDQSDQSADMDYQLSLQSDINKNQESIETERQHNPNLQRENAVNSQSLEAEGSQISPNEDTSVNVFKPNETTAHATTQKAYSVQRRKTHMRSSSTSRVEEEKKNVEKASQPQLRPQSTLVDCTLDAGNLKRLEHNQPPDTRKSAECFKVGRTWSMTCQTFSSCSNKCISCYIINSGIFRTKGS